MASSRFNLMTTRYQQDTQTYLVLQGRDSQRSPAGKPEKRRLHSDQRYRVRLEIIKQGPHQFATHIPVQEKNLKSWIDSKSLRPATLSLPLVLVDAYTRNTYKSLNRYMRAHAAFDLPFE